jgi:uncharacterized protein YbjQ (UPF0145 family)
MLASGDGVWEFIQLGIPLLLICLGFLVGRVVERRHLRSLARREALSGPVLTNLESLPEGMRASASWFCMGSVVIASDYFKFTGAVLKNLVGGRLRTLETLIDRGRREALLRLREQAARHGADMVLNIRLETAIILRGKRNQPYPAPEVVAYGTAVKLT